MRHNIRQLPLCQVCESSQAGFRALLTRLLSPGSSACCTGLCAPFGSQREWGGGDSRDKGLIYQNGKPQ